VKREMIEENRLISVIVPVYNVEGYLNRCLKSLINQTYKNLEIILVDDGSSDDSGKMCDEWCRRDDRIVVIHQKNKGLAGARNTGMDCAHGELLGFIDSDDWITDDYYEYLYRLMIFNEADIVSCSFQKKSKKTKEKKGKVDVYRQKDAQIFFLNSAIKNSSNDASCCTKLYKRNIIGKVRFEEGMIYEDVVFNWKVLLSVRCYVKSYEKKYFYYTNNESITKKNFSERNFDLIRGAKIIAESVEPSNEIKKITEEYMAKCHFSIVIKLLKSKDVDSALLTEELMILKKNRGILLKSPLSFPRKMIVVALNIIPNSWLCGIK
jgi:glycosyltransferase involved in cell wall biosynthesis